MKPEEQRPGEAVAPCQDAPAVRWRSEAEEQPRFETTKEAEGYTSRGHVGHFLPDREVNLAKLNKALADVYGEPALRLTKLDVEIDQSYWEQICSDPWSGNVYTYRFRAPEIDPGEQPIA